MISFWPPGVQISPNIAYLLFPRVDMQERNNSLLLGSKGFDEFGLRLDVHKFSHSTQDPDRQEGLEYARGGEN